jgi:hypothetical protein
MNLMRNAADQQSVHASVVSCDGEIMKGPAVTIDGGTKAYLGPDKQSRGSRRLFGVTGSTEQWPRR